VTRHRPIGITILAVLAAVATVLAGIHTLQYLHLLPLTLGPMAFFGFDLWGAILWAITTFVWAWVAVQLWNVNPQGWMFLILISAFDIILALISVIGATTLSAVLPSIVVNGIVLIYCLTPGVKSAFGQATV
jgi:hypothetical protein